MSNRYCVDGHEFPNEESELLGDGQYPPFRIFDKEWQQYAGETYTTREAAQKRCDKANQIAANAVARRIRHRKNHATKKRAYAFAAKLKVVSLMVDELLRHSEGASTLTPQEAKAMRAIAIGLCGRWRIVDVPGLPETFEADA